MTIVNKQDHCEATDQQTKIEDLTINTDQATEVKGGSHKEWINLESVSLPTRLAGSGGS